MNPESKEVFLIGIGEIGLETIQIIRRNKVNRITTLGIEKESKLKLLDIKTIEEAELVILVADLGYKKENSLAIRVSRLIKSQRKVGIAILSIPRHFEGEKLIERNLETVGEIGETLDSSLLINKEAFYTVPENGSSFANLINSSEPAAEWIASAIQNIMTLISVSEGVNICLDDLKSTLSHSGTFVIEKGVGCKENRIRDAIAMALSSPKMRTCDIITPRNIIIKVLSPKKSPVSINEMNFISAFVNKFPSYVDVKWGEGTADDDDLLSVIILASGFDVELPKNVFPKLNEDFEFNWGIAETDTLENRQVAATLITSGSSDGYEEFRALALNPPYIDRESVYRVDIHSYLKEKANDDSEAKVGRTHSFIYSDWAGAENKLKQVLTDETISGNLFAVYIYQLPIAMDIADGLYQRLWVYDRNGHFNGQSQCSSLIEDIDHCSAKFRGHEANLIRFNPGDVVEAYDHEKCVLQPVVIISLPWTIERCFRVFAEMVKVCSAEGLPIEVADDNYWLRTDDDSYFVVDGHGHTFQVRTYDIFPLSQQLPDRVRENITKCYGIAIESGSSRWIELYEML